MMLHTPTDTLVTNVVMDPPFAYGRSAQVTHPTLGVIRVPASTLTLARWAVEAREPVVPDADWALAVAPEATIDDDPIAQAHGWDR